MTQALVSILAVTLDWLFGDPPNRWHPVAWLGRWLQWLERHAPPDSASPHTQLLYGVGMTATAVTLALLPARIFERVLRLDSWLGIVVTAALLKITLAWRGLIRAGAQVQHALEAEQLEVARASLRALVSRDTRTLDASQLAAAAIESLAENASDAVVAPLFYYILFGLPGAFVYRAVNTLDAMIGYRGRYEYLGKFAARLDDALNFIPARVTALLLVIAARVCGARARRACYIMQRDHARTASPNAGYPMSAMAGALDVRLEKVGHYTLNPDGRAPHADDIRRAARVVNVALLLALLVTFLGLRIADRGSWIEHPKSDIRNPK